MVRHYRILPILYHPVCFGFIADYPIIRLFFFAKCYQCLFAYRIIIVVRGLFYPVAYISKSVSTFTGFSVKCQFIQIFYFHNDGANCKLLIRRIAMVEDITKLLYVTTYGEDFFLYANMPLSPSRNPSARNMVYRHSSKLALLSAIALVVFSIFLPNSLRRDNSSFISTTHPLAFLEKVG